MSTQLPRRGATIVVVALILPALLLLVGFSVDLAYMQQVRTELRVATDLAAKAASVELADTGMSSKAITRGKAVASENFVGGTPLSLENADFEFGNADRDTGSRWTFTAGATPTNAVRVSGRRTTGSPDGPVGLYFSGLLNGYVFEPTSQSTASFIDVDICLVLDRSSSMKLAVTSTGTGMSTGDVRFCDVPWADSRWKALENAVTVFLTQLDTSLADEQVALVTFASDFTDCGVTTDVVTTDEGLTTITNLISTAMSNLTSSIWNGATEIDDGIARGRSVLTGGGTRPAAFKVMVLLTDGSYTGEDPLPAAQAAATDEIKIHTITFGAGANQAEMQGVAAAAGGNHYHAPDAASLEQVFREIAGTITILTE